MPRLMPSDNKLTLWNEQYFSAFIHQARPLYLHHLITFCGLKRWAGQRPPPHWAASVASLRAVGLKPQRQPDVRRRELIKVPGRRLSAGGHRFWRITAECCPVGPQRRTLMLSKPPIVSQSSLYTRSNPAFGHGTGERCILGHTQCCWSRRWKLQERYKHIVGANATQKQEKQQLQNIGTRWLQAVCSGASTFCSLYNCILFAFFFFVCQCMWVRDWSRNSNFIVCKTFKNTKQEYFVQQDAKPKTNCRIKSNWQLQQL